MGFLDDRLVFITGASSGIGRECARVFAREGARLVLVARRLERLRDLAAECAQAYGSEVHCIQLDVRNRTEVAEALSSLPERWRAVDILVNNAGLSRGLAPISEGVIDDWEEMIDTNVKGLLYVTRSLLPGMVERGPGQIVNLGSIAGREVYKGGGVYCASKWAVRALTQALRVDLLGTPIRVSTVDPGLVETEFSKVRFHGDEERAKAVYRGTRPLTPRDVAEVVLFCATRPPHVTVAEVVLLSTDQASATAVYRRNEESQ
jgi:NADP-dependent 3-hydroxy acid dehydrogenase YdfG